MHQVTGQHLLLSRCYKRGDRSQRNQRKAELAQPPVWLMPSQHSRPHVLCQVLYPGTEALSSQVHMGYSQTLTLPQHTTNTSINLISRIAWITSDLNAPNSKSRWNGREKDHWPEKQKTKRKNTHSMTEFLDNSIKYYMPVLWVIQLRQGSEEYLWLKYLYQYKF